MSAVDEIRAAIEKLTELEAESFPGEWEVLTSGIEGGDHWYVVADQEAILSVSANDGDDEAFRGPTANLVVALHRTIYAQLVGLRKGLDYLLNGWHEGGDVAQLALALARAINGGTK